MWDRLAVNRKTGTEFTVSNLLMIAYRQTIFAKVISALTRIGRTTERVRDGLTSLELIGPRGVTPKAR